MDRSQPLENRVAPDGLLHGVRARGDFMGNRGGQFHNPVNQTLRGKHWKDKRWICCLTSFRDRHRTVWGQGYTELFFLDEVTALAAGHRPCFECRRADAIRFAKAWADSRRDPGRAFADPMDIVLHDERTAPVRQTLTVPQAVALPEGAVAAVGGRPFAVRNGKLLPWSFDGYGAPVRIPDSGGLTLLTPPSIVNVLRIGYRPVWHESAG